MYWTDAIRALLGLVQFAWDFFKSVLVPLGVGALAAWIATRQLRATLRSQADTAARAEANRTAERRERAVHAGVEALITTATSPFAATYAESVGARTRSNWSLTSMYSLLDPDEIIIGRWIAKTNVVIAQETERVPQHLVGQAEAAEDVRALNAQMVEAWAVQHLLVWLRGDRPLSWFDDDLARLDAGGSPDVGTDSLS